MGGYYHRARLAQLSDCYTMTRLLAFVVSINEYRLVLAITPLTDNAFEYERMLGTTMTYE